MGFIIINQSSDKSEEVNDENGVMVGKGLRGGEERGGEEALIFSFLWKCLSGKKARERQKQRHLSLSSFAFISFQLILNFHYSPQKAKPSLFTPPPSDTTGPSSPHTHTLIHSLTQSHTLACTRSLQPNPIINHPYQFLTSPCYLLFNH